ncbi:MAG: hypothetical protein CYPHOPRED_004553 [Cyphobasidiales sp. Tagirdzhanova-0007]|nr:MAG: hypothetical protein CYPHOPRED_004553 [Cyphobasidiales sp. Tagirdzhanova-0007]
MGIKTGPVQLIGDNAGALELAANPRSPSLAKHMRLRQHFIRDGVQDGSIIFSYTLYPDSALPKVLGFSSLMARWSDKSCGKGTPEGLGEWFVAPQIKV